MGKCLLSLMQWTILELALTHKAHISFVNKVRHHQVLSIFYSSRCELLYWIESPLFLIEQMKLFGLLYLIVSILSFCQVRVYLYFLKMVMLNILHTCNLLRFEAVSADLITAVHFFIWYVLTSEFLNLILHIEIA